jgi:gamma-glutamyl-gamma-aminobutyraldehyde dehydrogenase
VADTGQKSGPIGQAFIGGRFCDAASGETFANINPASGEVLANVAACNVEDVNRAVKAARCAFDAGSWSRVAPAERKRVMLRLAELIRENLTELALLDSLDMGKLVTDAVTINAPGSSVFFQWYAEAIDKIYDEIASTGPVTAA